MAHMISATPGSKFRPGVLAALLLTGAIGFALGQSWPLASFSKDTSVVPMHEDWHGNVRRSHWGS